ncbi:MAG: lamin tail domain-containing protein, partial [Chthoniobacteraceae bacterium]
MTHPLFRILFLFITLASLLTARADVIISEFVANNDTGLADEDGSREDWIELYNDGAAAVSLSGWRLTDDAGNASKWIFPAVTLEPKGFLVVFASAKDRNNPAGVLHTNFKLSADGGYLALIRANSTIATQFNPYPAQYDDRPYGYGQSVTTTTLIGPGAAVKYLVPTSATPTNATWTPRTFNDTSWSNGTSGLGFEATVPGWAFKTYFSNTAIPNLTQAEAVIVTPALQSSVQQTNWPVINFDNTGSPGNYTPENAPSWLTSGDADQYVVEGTGIITVPTAGVWTFCVRSDDGCSLQIRPIAGSYTTLTSFTGLRGMGDSIGTYNFPSAGQYEIRAVIFENGGGSGGEVSARAGSVGAWDGTFKVIGDTAGGGLAIQSLATGAGGGYGPFTATNLKAAMFDAVPQKSSCYARYHFTNPGGLTSLSLPVRYDDGIAVYLNGTLAASRLAPVSPTNTSTATGDHPKFLARQQETLDLTPFLSSLVAGDNVVAIHGLNQAAGSGDFLLEAQLYRYVVTITPAANFYTSATPGAFNTAAIYNKVAPVVASVARGFYSAAQNVALTTGTAGATIRYTFDGSTPVEAAGSTATYSGPIAISGTRTLRYRAFKAGSDASEVGTQTYIFTSDVIGQQPTGTPPTITNPTGATIATTTWPGVFDTVTGKYQINGQELDFGMDPDVVNNPTYSGTIQNDLKAIPTFSIVTDLPNLFDSGTGIYVNPNGDTAVWERPASIELINPDGTPGFQVNCGLRLRGGFSRSTGNPKHAFRLFFRDSYGPSKLNYDLFGSDPTGTDSFDKFDLRCAQNYSWSFGGDGNGNFLGDPMARDQQLAMGQPSSHGGFYHLYVNGQYWGLYNIDERPDANFGQSYFGGNDANFDAVKVDPDIGYNIEATDGTLDAWGQLWTLADGGLAAANTEAANNAAYQRVLGRNADGSVNAAYPVLFDAINTIDSMLVVYWGGNLDAQISAFLSNNSPNNSFFLRDRTGASGGFKSVLHDSEHTLLNVNENRLGPWPAGSSIVANGGGFPKSTPQYVFQQCMNAQEFRALAADRLFKHCYNNGVLTPATALTMFNARTAQIDRAVVAESARWGDSKTATPLTRDNWLSACANVRNNFLPGRTAVLIAQMRALGWYPAFDPPVFSQRGGTVTAGTAITLTFAAGTPGGSTLFYTVDGSDPRAFGGGVAGTALSIASGGSVVINTSKLIRVRTKNGTTWSALDEAAFYVTQDLSPLAITEIHYNPLPTIAGGIDGADYEFVEFKNTGTGTLDLGGLTFSAGMTFSFSPGTTLAPGAFFVLVKNAAKFAARHPGVTIGGVITAGSLDNSGELLALVTAGGGAVLTVNYDDDPPWPAAADGSGFSIVPNGTNYNSDAGTNWRASANVHGSPGADDPAANFAPIKINEALTNSLLPLKDTIELYNPSPAPVNVGDWWLTDDRNTPQKYRIPASTIIPAGGYLVFDETQFNPTPGVGASFALNGNGDDVYLFAGNAGGALTGYSHGWDFAAAEQDVSFGRHVNSVGEEHFPRQTSRTFGAFNAGPRVGPLVLNEIMYHPYTGYDEYIEIRNLTGSPVSLDGPGSNTWKIAGIGYVFPAGQSVPANGYVLVTGIDPATFRTKYGISAAVPVFGPYAGVLQDSGEQLSLEQPGVPYVNSLGQTVVPYIVIDAVRYNDKAPWPVDADGNGPSLQRLVSSDYADDPMNWFASGATPGAGNGTNVNPTVTLTAPANGANFTVPATVNFTASASDTDGTIAKVEYYVDGAKVGEATVTPFAFAWAATGGIHNCTAIAIDNALGTAASAPITIFVTTTVTQGLKAEYYNNRFLSAPIAFTRTDTTVNFSDGGGAWVNFGGVGVDQFSVRWSGQVRPTSTGTYTFFTNSDDGVRLYVNSQTIVDNWTDHGPT